MPGSILSCQFHWSTSHLYSSLYNASNCLKVSLHLISWTSDSIAHVPRDLCFYDKAPASNMCLYKTEAKWWHEPSKTQCINGNRSVSNCSIYLDWFTRHLYRQVIYTRCRWTISTRKLDSSVISPFSYSPYLVLPDNGSIPANEERERGKEDD